MNNVFIQHFSHGPGGLALREERSLHNVWVVSGQTYLAQMVGAIAYGGDPLNPLPSDPIVVERSDRLKYMGLGIGSVDQGSAVVDVAPISTAYPVGYASAVYAPDYVPGGFSDGKSYNRDYPICPLVSTLERPVRRSGGTADYGSYPPTDVWRFGPPTLYVTHTSTQDVTVHVAVDASAGDVVYSPFTQMPITEAALYTDATGTTEAYGGLVAYVNFDTILLDSNSLVLFTWQVRFG